MRINDNPDVVEPEEPGAFYRTLRYREAERAHEDLDVALAYTMSIITETRDADNTRISVLKEVERGFDWPHDGRTTPQRQVVAVLWSR
jgi:hypothetical protein